MNAAPIQTSTHQHDNADDDEHAQQHAEVGGMLSALVLTMLVIPAVYLLWEWRRLRKTVRQ